MAIVEALLDAGANLEAPSETGTPLLWAAGSGSQEVVGQLLAAGADPNARAADGVTAMLMAAASGPPPPFPLPSCFLLSPPPLPPLFVCLPQVVSTDERDHMVDLLSLIIKTKEF